MNGHVKNRVCRDFGILHGDDKCVIIGGIKVQLRRVDLQHFTGSYVGIGCNRHELAVENVLVEAVVNREVFFVAVGIERPALGDFPLCIDRDVAGNFNRFYRFAGRRECPA